MKQSVDVKALVAEIEATVERKKQAGEYPQALLDQLHKEFSIQSEHLPPEALAVIESYTPILSSRRFLGSLIVWSKKVIRRLLAWYINPIAKQQTDFNIELLRELRTMERRLDDLEDRIKQ